MIVYSVRSGRRDPFCRIDKEHLHKKRQTNKTILAEIAYLEAVAYLFYNATT